MNRREFLSGSVALAAVGTVVGADSREGRAPSRPQRPAGTVASADDTEVVPSGTSVKVVSAEAFFAAAETAAATVIVDLRDGVRYPSHPELATAKSRDAEAVRAALAEWKRRGVKIVPLLDLSAAHDEWLGEYDRMLGSKRYDRVVEDLVRDTAALFEKPEYIHVGFESEDLDAYPPDAPYYAMRQGDLWMRYLNWTSGLVRAAGAKPWVWFDYPWKIEDFLAGCPKDARYSNYRPLVEKRYVWKYSQLRKAGLDTVDIEGGAR